LSDDMYTKLTSMITPYEEITCVYRKAHMIVMQVIFRLKITKLSYVWLYVVIIKDNKRLDIIYNMNYIKVFEWDLKKV
jgi:hypothetical protein